MINQKLNEGCEISGTIKIQKHGLHGRLIGEKDFQEFSKNIYIEYFNDYHSSGVEFVEILLKSLIFSFLPSKLKNRKIDEINLIFPLKIDLYHTLQELRINKSYNIRFIVIDEGLGSYQSKEIRNLEKSVSDQRSFLGRVYFEFIERLKSRIISSQQIEKRLLFNKIQDSWEPNYPIINQYRYYLLKTTPNLKKLNFSNSNKLVIITQPWSELNELSIDVEVNVLETLINKFESSYKIFIKTHPRETRGKYKDLYANYNINIIEDVFPIEELFQLLSSNDIVIGYQSTALINANLFYGLKSYSISHYIVENENFGSYFLEHYKSFLSISSKFVDQLTI